MRIKERWELLHSPPDRKFFDTSCKLISRQWRLVELNADKSYFISTRFRFQRHLVATMEVEQERLKKPFERRTVSCTLITVSTKHSIEPPLISTKTESD
ncbi:hypothetical protein L2E82_50592 [Cichorium intybus]|nr:hypothetical protein L2E82_50592 [Cichorium intybus]